MGRTDREDGGQDHQRASPEEVRQVERHEPEAREAGGRDGVAEREQDGVAEGHRSALPV